MSLLDAVADYITNSSDTNMVALRAIIGEGFYADVMPETVAYPYIVLAESDRGVVQYVKGMTTWIEDRPVAVGVVAAARADVDAILELLDFGFIDCPQLTITNANHMATTLGTRQQGIADATNTDVWTGAAEIIFKLQRLKP